MVVDAAVVVAVEITVHSRLLSRLSQPPVPVLRHKIHLLSPLSQPQAQVLVLNHLPRGSLTIRIMNFPIQIKLPLEHVFYHLL